jgi:hypothetical protein
MLNNFIYKQTVNGIALGTECQKSRGVMHILV